MTVRLCIKIWLAGDGGKAFGDGAWDLLVRVDRLASLRQAAGEIGMSYSQAWKLVRSLEAQLGFPLLVKTAGGAGGGGSVLTDEARVWVEAYGTFRQECQDFIVSRFATHFRDLVPSYEVGEPGRRPRA